MTEDLLKEIKKDKKLKKRVNKAILHLLENTKRKFKIIELTPLDGNCIFSSLFKLGYGSSARVLRKATSIIMFDYRDYEGFYPNNSTDTLKNLYKMYGGDEKEVYSYNDDDIIKYNFKTMCRDLSRSGSWTRINAELVFLTLSRIFNIVLVIHSDKYETSQRYSCSTEYKTEVHLGHLDNLHYVPLIPVDYVIKETFQYKYDDGSGFEKEHDEYESVTLESGDDDLYES